MRYQVETQPERPTEDLPVISCPEDVRRLLGPEMAPLAQEQLRVLLLNTRNQVMGQRVIYQGNVSSAIVRTAEVFRPAVNLGLPAEAAAGRRPHHPGRRRHGPLGGLQAVRRSPRDHRNVDDQDHPPAGLRRLARPGLHQDRLSSHSRRTASCCWRRRKRTPPRSTTASSTSGARCPCTAPGPTGSGGGAWTTGRSCSLQSVGVSAYRCSPKAGKLREDLSGAVASGWLTLPREEGETDG